MASPEEEEYDPQFEFYECCRYGDEETGISILQAYPDIDVTKPDEFGTTPLHAVAANGLVRLLEEIVKRPGVNFEIATPGGNTPLHYAAVNRNRKIIEILLKAGANVKARNSQGQSPLYEAMSRFDEKDKDAPATVDLLVGPDSEIPPEVQVPAGDVDA
jgi:ankyrin repeat protein